MLIWELAAGRALVPPDTALGGAIFALALFNLLAGYASAVVLAVIAAMRRGIGRLIPNLLLVPVYWLMISLAAYRAMLQLVTQPYLWEKTPHAARHSVGARPSGRGGK